MSICANLCNTINFKNKLNIRYSFVSESSIYGELGL